MRRPKPTGTVTILVTDLVGSTELNERLGDDAAERLLRAHLGTVRRLIRAHRGDVVKTTGDGLMAAFASALDALDCACAIQRAAHRAQSEGLEEHHVRIGLHAGETTSDEHDYYGTPVVVGRRLCDSADADQIVVSGVVRTLVGSRGGHEFEHLGPFELKGISDPVDAWAARWSPEGPEIQRSGAGHPSGRVLVAGAATVVLAVGAIAIVVARSGESTSPATPRASVQRVSTRGEGGAQAGSDSYRPAVSQDGELVAFTSNADLTTNRTDDNGLSDIYLFRGTEVRLISLTAEGTSTDAPSDEPSMSADGRVVAYTSDAANLVAGDGNEVGDIFVFVKGADGSTRVSVTRSGDEANGRSFDPDVSADGGFVAFGSDASNLSGNPDTNGVTDVFVHERSTGTTRRVSVGAGGEEGVRRSGSPSISEDGTEIAFKSAARNLVEDDTNSASDIFVYDRDLNRTVRVSVASDGTEGNGRSYSPEISADGDHVVFVSTADNLVPGDDNGVADVFLHRISDGQTTRMSISSSETEADGASYTPVVSDDGSVVAFVSEATNLAVDTGAFTNVFVHSIRSGTTELVSGAFAGAEPDGDSFGPALSSDGRVVVFTSLATNLVEGDTNQARDVFRWEREREGPGEATELG